MRSPLPHRVNIWMPTEMQASILEYIKGRQRIGLGTTRSQVTTQFGFTNKANASYHLRQLHKLKLLNWKPKSTPVFEISSGIRVLGEVC